VLTEPLVAVRDVVKDYKGLRPFRLQSLDLSAGDVVTLTGPDRLMASVLTDLLTGTTVPDSGEIEVAGHRTRDIADHDAWLSFLDQFGLVNDRVVLLEALTVAQNLAVPLTLELDPMPASVRARVEQLAAAVDLPGDILDQPVAPHGVAVSARVRLGRAIALDPRILVIEHPTADLPRDAAAPLGKTVRQLAAARGLAVLAVSSDAAFCELAATRRLSWRPGDGSVSEAGGWRRFFGGS